MASSIVEMSTFTLANAESTKLYKLTVHPDVHTKLAKDTALATRVFETLESRYPIDGTGERVLKVTGVAETLMVVSDFGLLNPLREAVLGQGVSISKKTKFDAVSQAAYESSISDDTLFNLGRVIPKDLTAGEKVRYLEHLVAAIPKDVTTEVSVPQESQECQDDDNESMFSSQCTSVMEDQSQSQAPMKWSQSQVTLLMSLRKDLAHLFSSSTVNQKQAWRKVSEEMCLKGHHFSGEDCQRKFNSLKQRFKTIKDRNGKSGRGRTTWIHYDLMANFMEGDPAVHPVAEVSSMGPPACSSAPLLPIPSLEGCSDILPSPSRSKTPVKDITPRKSSLSACLHELAELRAEQKRQHEERMDMERKRLEVESKRLETLNKFVDAFVESLKK